jgi:hypothetical protein
VRCLFVLCCHRRRVHAINPQHMDQSLDHLNLEVYLMVDEQEAVNETYLGWLKTSRPSWPGHPGIDLLVNHQRAVKIPPTPRRRRAQQNQGTENTKRIVQFGQERAHNILVRVNFVVLASYYLRLIALFEPLA